MNCILLRYGEVGLKTKNIRTFFEKKYVDSIHEALEKNNIKDYKLENLGGRYVLYSNQASEAVPVLRTIAGIQSISPAIHAKFNDLDKLTSLIGEHCNPMIKKHQSFGLDIKRVGKHHFSSKEVAIKGGQAINNINVNLKNPDVKIHIEIRKDNVYIFTDSYKGVGGLPTGCSEKVLCLFSGGIDSPVAAYQMIKRGCKTDYLFVNIAGERLFNQVGKVYNYLISNYCYTYKPKLYVVDGKEIMKYIMKEVPDYLRQVAYKIALYKIASYIGKNYAGVVTGESISQKSSQTLPNLLFIEKFAKVPILRPLLTFDKIEIMKIARDIGTMTSSEKIKEYCNLSEGPVTTIPIDNKTQDIPEELIDNIPIKKHISIVEVEDIIKDIPKKFISIDIRSPSMIKKNPVKTDLQIPFIEMPDRMSEFKKENAYVFVCEFGVKGDDIAYDLNKKGISAAGLSLKSFKTHLQAEQL